MVLDKTVEVVLNSSNMKRYQEKGYKIPKVKNKGKFQTPKGTTIIVKTSDLSATSNVFISIMCDCEDCKRPIRPMRWSDYTRYVHDDGKYYCHKCSHILFGGENMRKTKMLLIGSIFETHPHLIKYFVNIEDAKKYSFGSNKVVKMKCPDCGYIKNRMICKLVHQGFSCPKCSDKISYPEKIMFSVLEQLEIDFDTQLSKKTFKWCNGYRYDFYIISVNGIIETHGLQHYKDSSGVYSKTLQEVLENDKNKKVLANENNIKEYIVIDCRKSELKFIKNNILSSKLAELYDLSSINWLKCHEYACCSLVKVTCDLWNSGMKIRLIAFELKICNNTVIRYLKQGGKLGWNNYNKRKNIA